MLNNLINFLNNSKTSYQAIEITKNLLVKNNFIELNEGCNYKLEPNQNYFVVRDGSSMIAFKTGDLNEYSFNILASHTDSPCLKLKLNDSMTALNMTKLNVEKYGGAILHTFLDRKLVIAGRYIVNNNGVLESKLFTSKNYFVIPSVAIHYNRDVNNGLKINAQTDLCPLFSLNDKVKGAVDLIKRQCNDEIIDFDLYLVCGEDAYLNGADNEFLTAPRIDNLSSALASIEALLACQNKNISVCFLADNEEVGSRTKQGAGSKFLIDTLERINFSLNKSNEDFKIALNNSFMLSCDNAHANHLNHLELSDPTNKVLLGGGIVIKHHANQNYTTDSMSSAIMQNIFKAKSVSYQHFFMRSDLPCGGTLGAISSSQLSIRSCDIGLAQLAMHSAMEHIATDDYTHLVNGITAFFDTCIKPNSYNKVNLK